jgi:hypothetical protein
VLACPLREDEQVITKDDDDELVTQLNSKSTVRDVWSHASKPDNVQAAHEHEQLKLEELIFVEDRWDQDEDQPSNQ